MHPAEKLLETLVAYVNASKMWSPYYAAFYLTAVLRQMVEGMPDEVKAVAIEEIEKLTASMTEKTEAFYNDQDAN